MYIHTFKECSSKMSLLTFSHRILVQRKDYSSQAKDVDLADTLKKCLQNQK